MLGRNDSCSLCTCRSPKWLCLCKNEKICERCLSAHMSKPARAHVLVDYEIGISVPLSDEALQGYNRTLEVAEFLKTEAEWLIRERENCLYAVDTQVDAYIAEIRRVGEEKKLELKRLFGDLVQGLEGYKSAEKHQLVLETKKSARHLESLRCAFSRLQTESLIAFYRVSASARKYQWATSCRRGWSCDGPIDALTFRTSRDIKLSGLGIGKGEVPRSLALLSLEIAKGNSTLGEVIYSDSDSYTLDSDHEYLYELKLKRKVAIQANNLYTIKVQLMGGSAFSTPKLVSTEQDGLTVVTEKTVFRGEANNGSAPSGGVFFELYYVE